MKKKKYDSISLSLVWNLVASFGIALAAHLGVVVNYYRISWLAGLERLFLDNIYTVGYFVLLWLLNFVIFEAVKETFEQFPKIKYIEKNNRRLPLSLVVGVVFGAIVYLVNPPALFKVNFLVLIGWMIICHFVELLKTKEVPSSESQNINTD